MPVLKALKNGVWKNVSGSSGMSEHTHTKNDITDLQLSLDELLQSSNDYTDNAVNNKANASDLTAHTGNTSNPHSVTAAQLGIYVQDTEPVNAPVGAIWIDTSSDA